MDQGIEIALKALETAIADLERQEK